MLYNNFIVWIRELTFAGVCLEGKVVFCEVWLRCCYSSETSVVYMLTCYGVGYTRKQSASEVYESSIKARVSYFMHYL